MPDIELKPESYRVKGARRIRPRLVPVEWWGRLATASGVWAVTCIFLGGYVLDALPHLAPIWVIVAALAPGMLLWFYAAFTD
jgi:hypothetical protein